MNKATNVKKQILASQIAYKRTQNNEVQLEKALAKFFNKLKKEVLNALDDYWKDYQMLQGHIDLICAPVHEAHKEYYELLALYIKREYRLGSAEAKRLVKLANSKQRVASKSMRMPVRAIIKKDNDLFGTLPSAEERLLNRTFTASERTLSRVDSQINQIITDGYRSGKGLNDVANSLNQRFDQLTSWESKRIARTEIHNSHNTAVMDTYQELGVEYTMWIAAEDERTRDSHLEINGEIIPMGGTYSNGLAYPGDTSGDIEEWINCRCSNAPFVVPYGFMAPSFSPFREDDLVKVETKDPQEIMEQTLEQTLNEDKERLDWLKEQVEMGEDHLAKLSPDNPQYQSVQNMVERNRKEIKTLEERLFKETSKIPKTEAVEIERTLTNNETYKPYSKVAEENMDVFENKVKSQKVEYLQYFTDDGAKSPLVRGNWGEVRTSGAQKKWIEKQKSLGKQVHGTHNHPTEYKMSKYSDGHNTLLSDADNSGWLKDARKNLLDSFSAEGPENRFTISKMENFDKFTFTEQQKALNKADSYTYDYVNKFYKENPSLKMLREVKEDLRKQGIDWRAKSREDPKWWKSVNDNINSELQQMRTKAHAETVSKMNKELNKVGIRVDSVPRKK